MVAPFHTLSPGIIHNLFALCLRRYKVVSLHIVYVYCMPKARTARLLDLSQLICEFPLCSTLGVEVDFGWGIFSSL